MVNKLLRLRSGYSKLLLLFLSITIIPCLLLSLIAYQVSIRNARQQAENYSTQFLNLIQSSNDAMFEQVQGFIYELMLNFDTYNEILSESPYTSEVLKLFAALEKKRVSTSQYIKNFYLVNLPAEKMFASERSSIYEFEDFKDQPLIQLLTTNKQSLALNELFPRKTSTGENVVSYVVRYPLTGTIRGYIVIDLNLDQFMNKKGSLNEHYGQLIITNTKGRLLTPAYTELLKDVQANKSDYLQIESASHGTGLQYLYVIPESLINKNNQLLLNVILSVGAFFMLLEAVAAWLSSKRIYSPMRNLLLHVRHLVGDQQKPSESENEYQYVHQVVTKMNVENNEYIHAFKENKNLFKQKQLSRLLHGLPAAEASGAIPDRMRLHLPHPYYLVMVMEIGDMLDFNEKYTSLEQELLFYGMENITEEALAIQGVAVASRMAPYRIIALVNLEQAADQITVYEEMAYQLQFNVQNYVKLPVSIGIGAVCEGLKGIPTSSEQALRALSHNVYFGKESITHYANLKEQSDFDSELRTLPWEDIKVRLKLLLQAGQWEPVESYVRSTIDKAAYVGMTQTDLQFIYLNYTACLSDVCIEFSLHFKQLIEGDYRLDHVVKQMTTLTDLKQELINLVNALYERIIQTKVHVHQELIDRILHYIHDNIDADLTLESIAEKVYMHPAYLSRICKALTGKGLGEQIIQARIQKAKELLIQTGESVNDISAKVGYTNPRAFYRLFKDYTGFTPGEFRKKEGLKNVQ